MKSQKKIAAVLLIAACLGGYAAAPVYAAPKAQNQDRRGPAIPITSPRARQTPSATAPPICRTSSAIRQKIRKTPVRERRKIKSEKTNGASRGKREAPFSYAPKKMSGLSPLSAEK